MSNTTVIYLKDLPQELCQLQTKTEWAHWHEALLNWTQLQLMAGRNDIAKQAQSTFETVLIRTALDQCDGHRCLAAKRLGYGRNTLTRKIRELQLD